MHLNPMRVLLCTCVLSLLLACGCGGDGSGGPGGGDLTYEEVSAVLDDLVDAWNASGASSLEELYQEAADFLEGRREIAWVALRTGDGLPSLWAEFTDETSLFMPAAYVGHETDPEYDPPPPRPGSLFSIGDSGLPGKDMLSMQLAGLPASCSVVAGWAKTHGYQPTSRSGSVVEHFDGIDAYDIIHISSHGAYLKRSSGDLFAILTNEMRTKQRDDHFKNNADFSSKRVLLGMLVPVVAVGEYSIPQLRAQATHYAVSDRYIAAHNKTFDPYSVVLLDMCESAKPHVPPWPGNPLVKLLLAKGAGGVYGWDASVSPIAAIRGSKYVFSRLLGDDAFMTKEPPIRPFGAMATFEGAQAEGCAVDDMKNPADPSYVPSGANLVFAPRRFGSQNDQLDALLRPSIDKVDVTNLVTDEEIRLLGDFGSKKGEVCIAGDCSAPDEWDLTEITASCGRGKYGPVVVKVDGRESNEVPLTRWKGEFKVEGDVDPMIGPHIDVTFEVEFRGDIHKIRDKPESPANAPSSADVGALDYGVKCKYTVTSGEPPFQDEDYFYDYAGGGEPAVSEDGEYNGAATIRPLDGEMEFQIVCLVRGTTTKTDKETGEPDEEELVLPMVGMFEVGMDEYGQVQAGETTFSDMIPLPVTWQAFTLESAPDENTPG